MRARLLNYKDIPASSIPFYSVHAMGAQAHFILPAQELLAFLKYLRRVRCTHAFARSHHRVWFFVDVAYSEAEPAKPQRTIMLSGLMLKNPLITTHPKLGLSQAEIASALI